MSDTKCQLQQDTTVLLIQETLTANYSKEDA